MSSINILKNWNFQYIWFPSFKEQLSNWTVECVKLSHGQVFMISSLFNLQVSIYEVGIDFGWGICMRKPLEELPLSVKQPIKILGVAKFITLWIYKKEIMHWWGQEHAQRQWKITVVDERRIFSSPSRCICARVNSQEKPLSE